ncbi:flavodoxin family protein [Candidatus Thorarchaeota archaeon]|nr:MAG: flavodoxin family protein [Candidatus Thorarchaeota archaeon]
MEVLIINGSPRKGRMHTGRIVSHFAEGMKEAGANVETIYSIALSIGDCKGCFNCWTKTPGKCIQDDDMTDVLSKMASADILVLATPVYVDGMTGSLKTLIDRFLPHLKGRFVIRDDHCRHPVREHVKQGKVVLVSVSGFTELDNFDPLINHVRAICKNMNREFAGALVRSVAWIMDGAAEQGVQLDSIYEAVRQAGRELVSTGSMREETLETIRRDFVPRDTVVQLTQGFYDEE